jgi:carbamoyltransferase
MYILGLNVYHGDSSACLFKDGVLLCAFEEERFVRKKHWAGFPIISIKECLIVADISIENIDYISLGRDPKQHTFKKIINTLRYNRNLKSIFQRLKNLSKAGSIENEFSKAFGLPEGFFKNKIYNIEHHRSHLASAFLASPFEEASIISIDAFGDYCSTMLAKGIGNKIEVLESVLFPHSLGIFYTAFTQYLGFINYGDEYKIMGLAPFGNPIFLNEMSEILLIEPQGLFRLNLDFFIHHKKGITTRIFEDNDPTPSLLYSNKFIELFGPARDKSDQLTQVHKDIAASVQKYCEQVILHLVNRLHKTTNSSELCLAGGVAQNSVANGKIIGNSFFSKLFIPPAGHDAGTSIGSALYLYNCILDQPRIKPILSPYTGSKFGNESIEKILQENNVSYQLLSDAEIYNIVSEKLIEGGVVGWFTGRAEFGPRALGGRSILMDPRRTDAKEILNNKIKRRESFRPFAPSILKEYVSEYFEITDDVPFMEKVFPIRKQKHAVIPAVTHADGSGRLQTVDETVSPRYYNLINRFREKTGVPILLNTSFNENEPIVNTPQEALDCYLRTSMDMLVLENCVIQRS